MFVSRSSRTQILCLKSETRMPKPERIPKSEPRTSCFQPHTGLRISGFGFLSVFGFRTSVFRFDRPALLFHCFAMHSYELLREVFDKKAPKQVAADLGLSLSMVYKWAEPPDHAAGSGTGNPLDRIEALLTKHRRPPARPMDLPARRGIFHPQPEEHAASAFPDPGHQPDRPGIRRPPRRHRHRRRRQPDHPGGVQANPRPLGGIENGDGRFCGLLRGRKFRPDQKRSRQTRSGVSAVRQEVTVIRPSSP